jgi:PAS domain S-box-containing protein
LPKAPEHKRAEEALRESEDRFWRAFHASPACQIITTTGEGKIVDVNEAFCRMMGYEREDLLGHTTTELDFYVNPSDPQAGSDVFRLEGQVRDREADFRTRSGEIRSVVGSIEPIEWQGLQCIISTATDITERKRAEKATAEALETNRAIVENAPMGVMIFRATGQCVAANEAAGKILGATPAQLMQQNFYQIESWKQSGLYEAARQALSSGRPTLTEDEFTTTFGVHVWMRTVFTCFESGGELHLMMMIDDFTERKLTEMALRESEERFRTLVDGAPDGVYVQSEGRFRYLNPAMTKLLGATRPEDLIGSDIIERVAPEYRESVSSRIRAVRETKTPVPPAELEYLRLDGSRVAVETSAVSFPMGGEDVHLVFVRDRTERQKAETERAELQEQLQRAQRMESVGQLAGGVAHDFNNILMVQKGYCELMKLTLREGDPLADGLAQIEAYADRAAELTRQLLAFSRKQTLHPVDIDLNNLMADMDHMLRRVVGEDVEIATVLAPHPAMARVDRSQIEQVLVNLAVNARDAMSRGGKLTIEISWVEVDEAYTEGDPEFVPGPYVMLAISDTGHGMDIETTRRVFEPFFTTKGEGKGTGLGLSTVYGVIHQSGGNIRVESELGKGATFRIYLPRVEVSLARPAEPGVVGTGEGQLVLVVEDEPALRGLVVMMLEKLGYWVKEAANGREAVILVEEEGLKPDLLLTDVVMPEMGGSALAQRLRKDMSGLKVIYMSGYADDTVLDHGVITPGVDFLRKPFSMADLAAQVESALVGT